MASLVHGSAVVTNEGVWTEPLWRQSGAVALASDAAGMVLQINRVLSDISLQMGLSQGALLLYRQQFALENTIQKLMAVDR